MIDYITPNIYNINIMGQIIDHEDDDFTEVISKRSLIQDISTKLDDKSEIIFISQSGNYNYMKWTKQLKTPIVLQSIEKIGTNKYTFGIGGKYIKGIGDKAITINKDNYKKLMRFDLNFTTSGILNKDDPIVPTILKNDITDNDLLSHERTELMVQAMLYPIPYKMFKNNNEWVIYNPKTIILSCSNNNPGTEPLVIGSSR